MVRRPFLVAAACAALGAVLYLAVVHIPALQSADVRVLEGFIGLWRPSVGPLSQDLVRLFNPESFVVLTGAVLVAAAVAGRVRPAAVAFAAMLGANVTTQILKPLLATQREFPPGHFMGPEAWPSGHTTAVMSLSLAIVIVSTPRWRPLAAAFGGLLTIALVYSILILGGHYPSDVAGGFLVAMFWASLVTPLLRPEFQPSRPAQALGPAFGAVVLLAAGLGAVLLRPGAAVDYALANTTFVVGALALAGGRAGAQR